MPNLFFFSKSFIEFKESVSIDETDNSDKNVKLSKSSMHKAVLVFGSGLKYLLV